MNNLYEFDIFQGDAGGPLMCRSDDEWVQAGVVSLSPGENFRLAPFTVVRTSHYIPWIKNAIEQN